MKKEVREFYEKQFSYNKFFEKKKKISFDTSGDLLKLIDRLAELTRNNRTVTINALIGSGVAPFFKTLETFWKKHLKEYEGEGKDEFKKKMKNLLIDLEKLKKEYQIE